MISVTILAKNAERYLADVLQSLSRFDEIVVVDTGSEDQTVAIAKRFANVTLHVSPFIGFGPTHNVASGLAKHDWILSIDSDETLSPELARELLKLKLDPTRVYQIP